MTRSEQHIVAVVENDAGVPFRLNEHERALLVQQSEVWRAVLGLSHVPFAYTDGALTARNVTGFVRLGDALIEVVPKFLAGSDAGGASWQAALWAILTRVYRFPVLGSEVTGDVLLESRFPDLLGYVLLNSLRASRPSGRPMGYVSERRTLRTVRGHLDVSRILDVLLHPGSVPCEYDAYSEDVVVNRLLRWSAQQLATNVRSTPLGHDLMEEAMAFRGVSSVPPGWTEAERITLSPHHALLQPAVTVGQLLLAGRGLRHGMGTQEMPGFLWNSAVVFESMVRLLVQSAVRSVLPGSYIKRGAVTIGRPVGRELALYNDPDIRLAHVDSTIAILDAKYKTWRRVPVADDVRQVVTGAWVEDCPIGALIYPSPAATPKDPAEWRLEGPGNPKRLWALFVDLTEMADPEGERRLVDRLSIDLLKMISDGALSDSRHSRINSRVADRQPATGLHCRD